MKNLAIFTLLITFGYLNGMEQMPEIIPNTVVGSIVPRTKMSWIARLSNGQELSASVLYRSRKTRRTKQEDMLNCYYVGRIGKKRIKGSVAHDWVKKCILSAYYHGRN